MRSTTFALACVAATTMSVAPRSIEAARAGDAAPLTLASGRVSLEGTSNIHGYTASTRTVRVTAVEIGGTPEGDLLEHVLQPGGLKGFDVVIPVASLTSPKDGIDKNMHKALKAQEYPDISFRLRALEPAGGDYRALGLLKVAGVEREVTLNLQVERKAAALSVIGATDLLMTDFGVTPPKAMMGMLRTNPKVQIRLELMLTSG